MNHPDQHDVDSPIHSPSLQGAGTIFTELDALASRPRRHPALHWTAFILSLVSIALLAAVVSSEPGTVPSTWIGVDIFFDVAFVFEFFTRSGFRWSPLKYVRTHFFDFLAMAPALILVQQGVPLLDVWVWIILVARGIRSIDRLLGDGFVRRNIMALVEGFEEEITDRVLLRIVNSLHADLARGQYGAAIAESLKTNKASVMAKIHSKTPHGFMGRLFGIDTALDKAEEGTYEALLEILNSPEVDRAIRESIDAAFSEMRKELGVRTWRKHIGIKR